MTIKIATTTGVMAADAACAVFAVSGSGACETTQHDAAPADNAGPATSSMFISLHCGCCGIAAQSAVNEDASAQSDTGLGPTIASARINVLAKDRVNTYVVP